MSKPLELITYNIWESLGGALYADTDDPMRPINVGYEQVVKRLTETELAAEYQRMSHEFDIAKYGLECDDYTGRTRDWEDAGERADTLHRFATRPHYFEVPA